MRKIFIGIALLFVLVLGLCLFVFSFNPFRNMEAGVVQSKSPLSKTEAEVQCPIALPEGATNIQYTVWSLWQASQIFVRFEAPAGVCLQHAEVVLLKYSGSPGRTVTRTNRIGPIPMPLVISSTPLNLSWLDLPKFVAGVEFSLSTTPAPTVWVDTNRGCFYFLENK